MSQIISNKLEYVIQGIFSVKIISQILCVVTKLSSEKGKELDFSDDFKFSTRSIYTLLETEIQDTKHTNFYSCDFFVSFLYGLNLLAFIYVYK